MLTDKTSLPRRLTTQAPRCPTWLRGTWSHEWLQEGKERSSTLDVHYLQTPTYFADIRIPKDRTRISNAKSFTDLTDEQLRLLAGQNGYTGRTTLAGAIATWHEDIAFRPSDGTPDQGRLERVSRDRMYEHGLDGSYIESWKFLTDGQGRFLVVRVEHSGRLLQTLVVVGDQFVYVRNRARDLPLSPSFDALFKATNATREQIIEYLDCEFSAGRVRGGSVPWEIEQSTLPWREGRRLDFGRMPLSSGARSRWALWSLRGQKPAHERRWATEAKRVISTPISATMTWAVTSLIPCIVLRRRALSRIDAKAFPTRASSSASPCCKAVTRSRCTRSSARW